MTEWILIISLFWNSTGKAQSTIEMENKQACQTAANNFTNALAFCISRKTGEVFGGRK